ncbi:MAG TPA: neutral zinc metallopeptidase [Caulobacteraceae bacterium]|nr:neutral zinc metallopeptidase [Caulobacteraceae bacterium]
MRWDDERQSDNVQDDRGVSFGGGGGGGLMLGGGGLGAVVLVGLALLFGVDPRVLLQGGGDETQGVQTAPAGPRADDEDARFSRAVLAYTEDTWGEIFKEHGARYDPPTLVLYDEGHPTGCGFGQSAMGPFYCPVDHRVYLDLSFFHELSSRFGAPGRFAEAYVIAHEVGHHVQNLLGDAARTQAEQQAADRAEANRISVRVELQADCYAGVWAMRTNQREKVLEPGDVEQGLAAASAVGDDALQRQTQGRVVPDAFTHGTSAQRMRWFRRGFDSGRIEMCDTFQPDYGDL